MWVSMGPCERIQKTGKEGNVERRGPLIIQTPLTASFLLPGHLNSIERQKTGGSKNTLVGVRCMKMIKLVTIWPLTIKVVHMASWQEVKDSY